MSQSPFTGPGARRRLVLMLTALALLLFFSIDAFAHNVAEGNESYMQENSGVPFRSACNASCPTSAFGRLKGFFPRHRERQFSLAPPRGAA